MFFISIDLGISCKLKSEPAIHTSSYTDWRIKKQALLAPTAETGGK
ncbi:MAG: hypothetical protein R3Y56_04775 [Akkermansia sp.]